MKSNTKRWPATALIRVDLCPRCGEAHGELTYRRFELGDVHYTHWAYCPATGEPLLLDMAASKQQKASKFLVQFVGSGRKAQHPPNPAYPNGIDLRPEIPDGAPSCTVKLPYPAKEIGMWRIECTECAARVACTTAGRPDDPRSITLLCAHTGKPNTGEAG